MILAAFMVTGFLMASVYAVAMLRGRTDRYHRLGLLIPLTFGAAVTPVQIVVGDWAARFAAADQPLKLAAMEGLYTSGRGVPESLGGYYAGNRLHGALRIPDGLSLLLHLSPRGYVVGLQSAPASDRPPLVTLVHLSFDTMVAIGWPPGWSRSPGSRSRTRTRRGCTRGCPDGRCPWSRCPERRAPRPSSCWCGAGTSWSGSRRR
jgi:cytochrome d ubiquinol oxidase subunit I